MDLLDQQDHSVPPGSLVNLESVVLPVQQGPADQPDPEDLADQLEYLEALVT